MTPAKTNGRGHAGESLPALLESRREAIKAVLPPGIDIGRFMKVASVEFARIPALAACNPQSVLIAVMQAAELGLEVGKPLDLAHLVPFGQECQLLIDYKGLLHLARRSGEYLVIDSRLVHEEDDFLVEFTPSPAITHKPFMAGKTGRITHVYAYAKLTNGEILLEILTAEDVERVRSGSRSANSPAWKNHWGEMARKIATKRLLKRHPRSIELAAAAGLDDSDYGDLTPGVSRSDRLSQRLRPERLPQPESEFTASEGVTRPLGVEGPEDDTLDPDEREPGQD